MKTIKKTNKHGVPVDGIKYCSGQNCVSFAVVRVKRTLLCASCLYIYTIGFKHGANSRRKPELLAALKMANTILGVEASDSKYDNAKAKISAAIATAKGA